MLTFISYEYSPLLTCGLLFLCYLFKTHETGWHSESVSPGSQFLPPNAGMWNFLPYSGISVESEKEWVGRRAQRTGGQGTAAAPDPYRQPGLRSRTLREPRAGRGGAGLPALSLLRAPPAPSEGRGSASRRRQQWEAGPHPRQQPMGARGRALVGVARIVSGQPAVLAPTSKGI